MTPGNLANGSGDQTLWKNFLTYHAENFMFTADPENHLLKENFKGDFEVDIPDTKPIQKKPIQNSFSNYLNSAVGNLFVDFDVFSGLIETSPSLIKIDNQITSPISIYAGSILPGFPDYVTGPQIFNKDYWYNQGNIIVDCKSTGV